MLPLETYLPISKKKVNCLLCKIIKIIHIYNAILLFRTALLYEPFGILDKTFFLGLTLYLRDAYDFPRELRTYAYYTCLSVSLPVQ